MTALVSALLTFSLWIVAHLVVWRIRKPAGQYAALTGLGAAALAVSAAGFAAVRSGSPGLRTLVPATTLEYVDFLMLYVALAYLVTYSAIQADSPTMTLVLRLGEAGPSGLSVDEMLADLDDDVLVTLRLEDLVAGNLVRRHDGRYVISRRGALLAKTYIVYRRLLGMEKGG